MNMWYLLKDSDGKLSVSYTMVVITFFVLTLWLFLSMFTKVFHVDIRDFDPAGASVWFAPIATLYFGRRWHQAQVDATAQLGVNGANPAPVAEADETSPSPPPPPGDSKA